MEEADLQRLIDDGVPEGREIDYKLDLAVGTDDEKKEFLADVSSFANTVGGTLYIGIREENLLPVELVGLSVADQDLEIQRIENLLRNGLEPRLPGVNIRPIRLSTSRLVLVLEVSQSWALPHRVSLKGGHKFYARNSCGKYPVDVAELRGLFAQSEDLTERMRRFRHERLSAVQAGETPMGPGAWPKIVLHLIPIQSFKPGSMFDLSHVEGILTGLYFSQASRWSYRHNFEGFATFTADHQEGNPLTYVQVFRTGALEAADRFMLGYLGNQEQRYIPGSDFEKTIASALPQYLAVLSKLGIQPPVFLGLSLLGVKGYQMYHVGQSPFSRTPRHIERQELVLPEIAIDDFTADPFKLLKPVFDIVWNAAGWPGSASYTLAGEWRGQ
jgi:schlafen family protein